MKNLTTNLIFGLLICGLFSCKQPVDHSDIVKSIDIVPTSLEKVFLNDIGSIDKIIKLETPTDALIGQVNKIEFCNQSIYVMCQNQSIGLFEFDLSGKFIRKISRFGKGPGEILGIADFLIDTLKQVIVIIDSGQPLIHIFGMSGEYVKSVKCDLVYTSLYQMSGNKFCARTSYKHEKIIAIVNEDFKIVKQLGPENTVFYSGGYYRWSSKSDNGILLKPDVGNDTIYKLGNQELSPRYIINFGKHAVPHDLLYSSDRKRAVVEISNNHFASMVTSFFEFPPMIYFDFYYGRRESYFVIFNSSTNETRICEEIICEGGQKLPTAFSKIGDKIVCVIYPSNLMKEYLTTGPLKTYGNFDAFSSLQKKVNLEDNPLLVIISPKIK